MIDLKLARPVRDSRDLDTIRDVAGYAALLFEASR
jgi:hypothetical protein